MEINLQLNTMCFAIHMIKPILLCQTLCNYILVGENHIFGFLLLTSDIFVQLIPNTIS